MKDYYYYEFLGNYLHLLVVVVSGSFPRTNVYQKTRDRLNISLPVF